MGKASKKRLASKSGQIDQCKPPPPSTPDVFDNPAAELALKNLTPEQREHYRVIGEELYGRVDFPDAKVLNNMPPPMEECAAYIADGLKSGLLPKDLSDDEKRVAQEAWGKQWWIQFGFTDEEAV